MKFYIVRDGFIVPGAFSTYSDAGSMCEPGEMVFLADDRQALESILESAYYDDERRGMEEE